MNVFSSISGIGIVFGFLGISLLIIPFAVWMFINYRQIVLKKPFADKAVYVSKWFLYSYIGAIAAFIIMALVAY